MIKMKTSKKKDEPKYRKDAERNLDKFLDFMEERRGNIQETRARYMPSGKEDNEPEYYWITTTSTFRRFKYGY